MSNTYTLRDRESGVTRELDVETLSDAIDQAHAWARDGSYSDQESTIWVDTYILDADGDEVEKTTTRIDPPAPKCTDGSRDDHDWQSPHQLVGGLKENPGVHGNGGGVLITEVCMRCGCERVTNTWAHRSDTGEQGLTSVRYEAGKYKWDVIEADYET